MELERYQIIEAWSLNDLIELPDGETDEYEFKSSLISRADLKREIRIAASAFWNSGGGILIVGLNDNGIVDGGIPEMIGRQRLRDWVDRAISAVEPAGPYLIKLIPPESKSSPIHDEHVVLVIAFGESSVAPHMAPDKRYYVRAGTHSDPAGHFLVEAIRLRRRLMVPALRCMLRPALQDQNAVELVVLALNDTPAIDVKVKLAATQTKNTEILPLYIPVIDRNHSFVLDMTWIGIQTDQLMQGGVVVTLNYQDLAGRAFQEIQVLDPSHSIPPLAGRETDGQTTQLRLKDISEQIRQLRQAIENSARE